VLPLRLAIVTARFWPLAGEEEQRLASLARAWIDMGQAITVVAAGWKKSWPQQMCVGPVPLIRLRGAPKSNLSALRWKYSLHRWLRKNAGQFDAVIVAGLRQEAHVAVDAFAKTRFPVVALAQEGDIAWQQATSFGARYARRLRSAAAILASSDSHAARLRRAGYDKGLLHVWPPAADLPAPRSPLQRDAARLALGAVNHDLIAADHIPVALVVSRLEQAGGLAELVRAWRLVTLHHHEARLWIIGDGPGREALYRLICDLDLRGRVVLPGTFDCHAELLAAADFVLVPGCRETTPLSLVRAMAAGLPVVAGDSPSTRESLEDGKTGRLVSNDPRQWAQVIETLLAEPAGAVALGAAARDWIRTRPGPAECARKLLSLMNQLRDAAK
jgi:glycosyltransferase involved in cell wall biosynthesis